MGNMFKVKNKETLFEETRVCGLHYKIISFLQNFSFTHQPKKVAILEKCVVKNNTSKFSYRYSSEYRYSIQYKNLLK